MNAIFITGSTGYIGSYVATSLLNQSNQSLNLLIRAPSLLEGHKKLWEAWQLHVNWQQFLAFLPRCHLFLGDMTHFHFGLNEADYAALAQSTDSIIHIAASLNRKSEKTCLNSNLKGTLDRHRQRRIGVARPRRTFPISQGPMDSRGRP